MTMRYQSPNDDNAMIDARPEAGAFSDDTASGEMPRGEMTAPAAVSANSGEMPSGRMTEGATTNSSSSQTETITMPGVWRLVFVKNGE
jgi:hypothetical protein